LRAVKGQIISPFVAAQLLWSKLQRWSL